MATASREFEGVVCNGHLEAPVRRQIAELVSAFEGKKLRINITEAKRKRSQSQNAYYWGVVVEHIRQMFADAGTDLDKEQCHDFLKQHVGGLKEIVTDPAGMKRTVAKSSTKLTTREWEDYCEKIRAWAAGFDYQVPLPNEAAHG